MSHFFVRLASAVTVVLMAFTMTACTSTKTKEAPKQKQATEQVEKLEQNSEYSAVDSEWNEFYQ
jgi:hypothetical protein